MEDSEIFTKPRLSKKQKYIFITACNFPYLISWISGQSRGAITAMNQFFLTAGMKYGGKFVCTNAGKKGVLKTVIKKINKIKKKYLVSIIGIAGLVSLVGFGLYICKGKSNC